MSSLAQEAVGVTIRQLRIDEADLVASFYSSLSTESITSRFMCMIKATGDYVKTAFRRGIVYGAFLGNKLVGVGEAIPLDSTTVEVALTVGDEFQGRGFGTRLAAFILEDLRGRGFSRAIAYTSMSNHRMLRIGKKLGGNIRCTYGDCTIVFELRRRSILPQ
jgi:GNAT superfamily N-acetyltransferase